jgi:hypothetical protein
MNGRRFLLALALASPLLGLGVARADDEGLPTAPPAKTAERAAIAFGSLKVADLDVARGQALDWLKGVGKTDAATLKSFETLWQPQNGRPILERVAGTLALGDARAAKLLDEARDAQAAAPTEVPALLKDAKSPAFFRANLAMAYAKALCNRRVFEEALEAMRLVKSDQVVDPAAYYFHRAVAEHGLGLKDEAGRSIIAVIEDVADAPARYKDLSILMLYDMQSWRDKDLGWVARKMDNIERRLELARGGPKTQKMQKEVVARLDEIIKQLENQAKGSGQANGGG